jgi:hypothetical protein
LHIKTAFLNGRLDKEVWIEQSPGFQVGGSRLKCRLVRSLYCLKHAPHAWHQRLAEVLAEMRFQPRMGDMSLFVQEGKFGLVLFQDCHDRIIFEIEDVLQQCILFWFRVIMRLTYHYAFLLHFPSLCSPTACPAGRPMPPSFC